jgi:hypothetical protein
MAGREADEYRVLRNTIARRGTWRPALVLAGVSVWAALLIAVIVLLPYPLAATIPLLVLLVTFEASRILHFGSERIGRYLQVFHEETFGTDKRLAETPSWESVAMIFGARLPGAGGHPLFAPVFAMATAINFLAVMLPGPIPLELALMAVPHAALLAWLVVTDRAMRAQRTVELARFRALRDGKRD